MRGNQDWAEGKLNCVAVAKRCQPILWGAEAGMVLGRMPPKFHQFIGKNGTRLGPMNFSFIVCGLPPGGDGTLGNMASFC